MNDNRSFFFFFFESLPFTNLWQSHTVDVLRLEVGRWKQYKQEILGRNKPQLGWISSLCGNHQWGRLGLGLELE